MLGEISVDRVYLACGTTDLRKSIHALAVLKLSRLHGSLLCR
jgi:transposase